MTVVGEKDAKRHLVSACGAFLLTREQLHRQQIPNKLRHLRIINLYPGAFDTVGWKQPAQNVMQLSREYYDQFSEHYENHRFRGYHRLLDDMEVQLATRYCRGNVLEAGCGTGLILERLQSKAMQGMGIDLSHGMLSRAHDRTLRVAQADIGQLPFAAESFDAVVSFKVLAHVANIESTIAELTRVTRSGGYLVLEFYNKYSLRYLLKQAKTPNPIGTSYTDEDVYTRYDSLATIRQILPPDVELVTTRGIRIATPVAQVHDIPLLKNLFGWVERQCADIPLVRQLGGFLVVVLRKR